jgi:hypothetical protein
MKADGVGENLLQAARNLERAQSGRGAAIKMAAVTVFEPA